MKLGISRESLLRTSNTGRRPVACPQDMLCTRANSDDNEIVDDLNLDRGGL